MNTQKLRRKSYNLQQKRSRNRGAGMHSSQSLPNMSVHPTWSTHLQSSLVNHYQLTIHHSAWVPATPNELLKWLGLRFYIFDQSTAQGGPGGCGLILQPCGSYFRRPGVSGRNDVIHALPKPSGDLLLERGRCTGCFYKLPLCETQSCRPAFASTAVDD
jgi:hypothetical protein